MSYTSAPLPTTLSGPYDSPATATHALVLLHGFGDEGASWLQLAQVLRPLLPEHLQNGLALFAPNGPEATPMGQGRQWFRDNGWTFKDPQGMVRITGLLTSYLKHIQSAHGIPPERTVLLGFSQGAMTSLYATPRLPFALAGQVAIAGLMHEPLPPQVQPVPTLLLHGTDDDVVPADRSVESAAQYQSHAIPTQLELIDGMGHGLNAQGLAQLSVFLTSLFADPITNEAA